MGSNGAVLGGGGHKMCPGCRACPAGPCPLLSPPVSELRNIQMQQLPTEYADLCCSLVIQPIGSNVVQALLIMKKEERELV